LSLDSDKNTFSIVGATLDPDPELSKEIVGTGSTHNALGANMRFQTLGILDRGEYMSPSALYGCSVLTAPCERKREMCPLSFTPPPLAVSGCGNLVGRDSTLKLTPQ